MNKLIQTIFILFFSFLTVSVYAETDVNAEIVKKTITAFMQANNIPGVAVEIYKNGKPSSYYFGYANREKKIPVTENTIFELGSISKVMTSLLLAQQIDYAKVSLTDSVRKYMEDLPGEFDDITLQELATHTSGLPFDVPPSVQSRTQLVKFLKTWSPDVSPGDQWAYSNFGIGILGYALETIAHKNFNQLYRSHILSPLKMQPIALLVAKNLKQFYAQGYNKEGKPVETHSFGVFPTASGIKASAGDMRKFLSAAIGLPGTPERIFYPMRLTQTGYVKLPDRIQGLGWEINPLSSSSMHVYDEPQWMSLRPAQIKGFIDKPVFDGNSLIDKGGTTKGFRAYIAVIPNKKSGVVILANKRMTNNQIANVGRDILFKITKAET